MSVFAFHVSRGCALYGSAIAAALGFAAGASAQNQLPEIRVTAPKEQPKPKPKPKPKPNPQHPKPFTKNTL